MNSRQNLVFTFYRITCLQMTFGILMAFCVFSVYISPSTCLLAGPIYLKKKSNKNWLFARKMAVLLLLVACFCRNYSFALQKAKLSRFPIAFYFVVVSIFPLIVYGKAHFPRTNQYPQRTGKFMTCHAIIFIVFLMNTARNCRKKYGGHVNHQIINHHTTLFGSSVLSNASHNTVY